MIRRLHLLLFAASAIALGHGDEAWFGPVRLTSVETARLAAFCPSSAAGGEACQVAFHFHDVNGRLVKEANASILPGRSAGLDFALPAGARPGEIIPCLRVLRGTAYGSFQVFDNFTKRTRIQQAANEQASPRGGEHHFGVSALTGLDAGRLAAHCPVSHDAAAAGSPCEVVLMFLDTAGRLLKSSTATLPPGGTAFLDLRPSDLPTPGRQVEIVPCFFVGRGAAVTSFALIDLLTGLTTAYFHSASPTAAAR
jgi:hypothetical protein